MSGHHWSVLWPTLIWNHRLHFKTHYTRFHFTVSPECLKVSEMVGSWCPSVMLQLGKQLLVPPICSSAAAHTVPGRPGAFESLFLVIGCFTDEGQEPPLCLASLHCFSCQGEVLSCILMGAAAEEVVALRGCQGVELCSGFTDSPLPACWEVLRLAAVSRGQYFSEKPRRTRVLL